MKTHLVITSLIFILLPCSTWSKNVTKENDPINSLPKIFDMEDIHTCSKTENYCKLTITLKPKDPGSRLWKYVESTINSSYRYDRSKLQRSICSTEEKINKYPLKLITDELKGTNLTADISNIECMRKFSLHRGDYILVILGAVYTLLIVMSTYYDLSQSKTPNGIHRHRKNQYLLAFSIRRSWNNAISPKQNEDYNRLKCIQGIRIYNLMLIIKLHVEIFWFSANLSSVYYAEMVLENRTLKTLGALSSFLVQTNFLVSSWLLTNHIHEIYKAYGYFSIKQGIILITNRYFRLLPALFVMVLVMKSNFLMLFAGPNTFPLFNIASEGCQTNWWSTLLMINNIHYYADVCAQGSWYLSIDTQLYAANILFLYLGYKFKWNFRKAFFLMFVVSCLWFGLVIYANNLNVFCQLSMHFLTFGNLIRTLCLAKQYLSFYSNWSASIIGITLGTIYFKIKTKEFLIPWIFNFSWVIIFTVFPLLAMYLATSDLGFRPILAAIVGAMIKPIYCIGIGTGIMGMVVSKGGVLKKICEWKYALILSNFVYSIYLYHFGVVSTRIFTNNSLLTFSDLQISLVGDTIVSFIVGIVVTILIEQPGCAIQKLLLPQVKYSRATFADQNGTDTTKMLKKTK